MIIWHMEGYAISCTRINFTKDVCNVIRFCGNQNNENMSKGMTYGTKLSPSPAIFSFISDYKIKYLNKLLCLILGVDGCFIFFCTE